MGCQQDGRRAVPAWTRTISQTERGVAFQFGKLRSMEHHAKRQRQLSHRPHPAQSHHPRRTGARLRERGQPHPGRQGQQDIYTLQSYVPQAVLTRSRFEQSRLALLADPPAISTTPSAAGRITWRAASQSGSRVGLRIASRAMETLSGNWRSPPAPSCTTGSPLQHRPLVRRGLGLGQLEARLRHGPLQPRGSQEQRARHV